MVTREKWVLSYLNPYGLDVVNAIFSSKDDAIRYCLTHYNSDNSYYGKIIEDEDILLSSDNLKELFKPYHNLGFRITRVFVTITVPFLKKSEELAVKYYTDDLAFYLTHFKKEMEKFGFTNDDMVTVLGDSIKKVFIE